MIRIFYHVAAMGNSWQDVVTEQLTTMYISGLLDAADEIHIGVAGTQADVEAVREIADLDKVTIHGPFHIPHYEFPTLRLVRSISQPGDHVLYIHTKGVSHSGQARIAADEWRRYMMWGCVERWKECVDALQDHDMAGVQWTRLDNSYHRLCGAKCVWGGNFWWARGEYLRGLPVPNTDKNRFLAEGWTATGSPSIKELHNVTDGGPIRGGRRPTGPNVPGFSRISYTHEAMEFSMRPKTFEEVWPYTSRIDIINDLIRRRGYKRYLEIGVFQGHCIRGVKCEVKHGVDPAPCAPVTYKMTSDAFFSSNSDRYDIIFIDGLHTRDQVLKDVDNGIQCLNPGGCLVLHDCLPENEFHTRPYAEFERDRMIWTGTVWEAWAHMRMTRGDIYMRVIDVDFGVGVIEVGSQDTYRETPIMWGLYARERRQLMNVLTPAEFKLEMENGNA